MTLLIDDSFDDELTDNDLNPTIEELTSRSQLVPKIIHQTYKTIDIPEKWIPSQQKCQELHPDYQYILWTDEMSRDFIAKEYPWFLNTFDGYKYNIERADVIRYFVLVHYGGIYIDLDVACERKLDPLLTFPAFARKTIPTGISNDVMGSAPQHPFFLKTIKSLQNYDFNYLVPYITIMYSTGPLFLSVIWKQYRRWKLIPSNEILKIMFPEDYKKHTGAFFSILPGSSWHLGDAKFIKSLGDHLILAVFGGFLIAGIILYLEYSLYRCLINGTYKYPLQKLGLIKTYRYEALNNLKIRKNSNADETFEMISRDA
ncbi:hypothetical protein WICMUC_002582 [Wickerhamomyces mucosus]|uniref:inositol phosphorylceramide mannosyltransferase n=1 Tax=Wickerhamomyces mucosus TaxID=1378264 RepID=A0A9P8TEI2_9ASCO|nr:hypothetical protein WICMUC_002582 [Wickerhamomyces mucosus]